MCVLLCHAVYDYTEYDPITDAEAEGKHVVDPYTYDLKFFKPHQY